MSKDGNGKAFIKSKLTILPILYLPLGTGRQELHTTPTAVALPENCRARSVHCGIDGSMAITLNNKLLACGSNR